MKKVLAIAPYSYLPYYSGGQKFIAQFFEWLGKEKNLSVVSTVNNDFSLAKNYNGIPLLKTSFSRYYDRRLVKKILQLIKENEFDTIIWEHPYYAWLAKKIRKRTGIKTILHTHNIEYQRFRSTGRWWWPILRNYEKKFFKQADHILFISPEDKSFAIKNWNIPAKKCIDLPFGVEIDKYPTDRLPSKELIGNLHGIPKDEKILFFNGLLNYKPNLDALRVILDRVNPLLLNNPGFKYKILICGKGLPEEMNSLEAYKDRNVIYAGYTDEISSYYKASDILLNPVQSGGGVKTKIIEAIAYGCQVISTATGALGIESGTCGDKLSIIPDNDWKGFADDVTRSALTNHQTPASFYAHYYWGNVIDKLNKVLT